MQKSDIHNAKKIQSLWIAVSFCGLLAVISIGLTLIHVSPYVVKEANYISIMVSLMGVLFTIVVSYQIYNIIDLNRRFKQVDNAMNSMEKLHSQMKNKIVKIDDFLHIISGQGCVTRALTAVNNNKNDDAIILFLKGICDFLNVNNLNESISDLNKAIANLEKVLKMAQTINENNKKQVVELSDLVRSHVNYPIISQQFDNLLAILSKEST